MAASPSKSRSTTDIITACQGDKTPTDFGATRIKRKRSEDQSLDFEAFKNEIRTMIKSVIESQENEAKTVGPSIKEIQQSIMNIEQSMALLNAQNEDMKKKLNTLEVERKKDRDHIAILEDKIEDMQRQNRKSCIEIKNVPRKENETREDLLNITTELSKTVKCPELSVNQITDIYRIKGKPGKDKNDNKNIIVELSSTIMKSDLIAACKKYNHMNKSNKLSAKHLGIKQDGDSPIYVSEQLTPKAARLHYLARDLTRSQDYKYCWTSFGKVYVRKDDKTPVIPITSEAQIHNLNLI